MRSILRPLVRAVPSTSSGRASLPARVGVGLSVALCACGAPHFHPLRPLTRTADEGRTTPPPPLAVPARAPAQLESSTLPNGMRVLSVVRPDLPIAVVRYVASGAGTERETSAEVLLCELTAHALVSAGTHFEHAGDMRDVEISGMPIESLTSETYSALQFRVGASGVDEAVRILARTLRYPTFSELDSSVELLQHAVLEDWDHVGPVTEQLLQSLLFGAGDRRAASAKSKLEHLRSYDSAALRRWYAHYRPESSALVVVGQIDPEHVRAVAASAFGDWTVAEPPAERALPELEAPRFGSHVLSTNTPLSGIAVAYPTVGLSHPDYWAIMLLAHALGGTPSSATFRALRHRAAVTYDVGAYVRATRADGQLVLVTYVEPDTVAKAARLLFEQTGRFRERGLTAAEMAAAKWAVLDDLSLRQERNEQVAQELSALLAFGDPVEALSTIRARIEALTAGDMRAVARRYLDPGARVSVVVGPHTAGDARLGPFKSADFYTFR